MPDIPEAKYEYATYSVEQAYKPNFDDIREVVKYLRIKVLINRRFEKYCEDLARDIFSTPSHPSHPVTWRTMYEQDCGSAVGVRSDIA